ncbi:hypothetical protein CDAR_22661 [Caerostris darwini]|uniref:Uncharacterized protein n=1 Tax=Caerostris darwini TaxID=1538125 RepID=A0AAV4S3U5_9ARAC|nr:hypothetical protein CDAR_22661 [Caerostris darwini]
MSRLGHRCTQWTTGLVWTSRLGRPIEAGCRKLSLGFVNVVRRPRQGRKRIATASEDRYQAITIRRNRKSTDSQLSSELAPRTLWNVTLSVVEITANSHSVLYSNRFLFLPFHWAIAGILTLFPHHLKSPNRLRAVAPYTCRDPVFVLRFPVLKSVLK